MQNFMDSMSQNGSNSRNHVRPRSAGNVDDAHPMMPFEEDEDCGDNDDHNEYLFARRRSATLPTKFHQHIPNSAVHTVETHATSPQQCTPKTTAPVAQHPPPLSRRLFSKNNATPTVQQGAAAHEVLPNATPTVQNDVAQVVQPHAAQQAKPVQPKAGMKVILYEVVRSNARVALGTIVSTDPETIIGGVALGKQYVEVIVTNVLKRDAILPRTYAGVEKMADAHNQAIAWPKNRLKQMASNSVRKISSSVRKTAPDLQQGAGEKS